MSDTKRRTDMSSFVDYRLGVKRKLLIVDDEEINRMLLTNILI